MSFADLADGVMDVLRKLWCVLTRRHRNPENDTHTVWGLWRDEPGTPRYRVIEDRCVHCGRS